MRGLISTLPVAILFLSMYSYIIFPILGEIETLGSNEIDLLLVRDIDYLTMGYTIPKYMPGVWDQSFPDLSYKSINSAFRLSIPPGHKFIMKALKVYPTISFQFLRNGSYLPLFEVTDYMLSNLKFNVQIFRSCRVFSTHFLENINLNASFFDAMNDWEDDIGSLAFPCPSENPVFVKNSTRFSIIASTAVWWSSVYETSLFIAEDLNLNDGFLVDTTNFTDLTIASMNYFKFPNGHTDPSVLLLEPNCFWVKVEPVLPFFVYLDKVVPRPNDLPVRTTSDFILTESVRFPIWNTKMSSIQTDQTVPNSIDNTYMRLYNLNTTIYVRINNSDIYTPFFFSPNYRDIYSEAVSCWDPTNLLRMNAISMETVSPYNGLIYECNYFPECYLPNSQNSFGKTSPSRGLFAYMPTNYNIIVPTISYKIYGVNLAFFDFLSSSWNVTEQTSSSTTNENSGISGPISSPQSNYENVPEIGDLPYSPDDENIIDYYNNISNTNSSDLLNSTEYDDELSSNNFSDFLRNNIAAVVLILLFLLILFLCFGFCCWIWCSIRKKNQRENKVLELNKGIAEFDLYKKSCKCNNFNCKIFKRLKNSCKDCFSLCASKIREIEMSAVIEIKSSTLSEEEVSLKSGLKKDDGMTYVSSSHTEADGKTQMVIQRKSKKGKKKENNEIGGMDKPLQTINHLPDTMGDTLNDDTDDDSSTSGSISFESVDDKKPEDQVIAEENKKPKKLEGNKEEEGEGNKDDEKYKIF